MRADREEGADGRQVVEHAAIVPPRNRAPGGQGWPETAGTGSGALSSPGSLRHGGTSRNRSSKEPNTSATVSQISAWLMMPVATPIVDWMVREKISGPSGATSRPAALFSAARMSSRPDS